LSLSQIAEDQKHPRYLRLHSRICGSIVACQSQQLLALREIPLNEMVHVTDDDDEDAFERTHLQLSSASIAPSSTTASRIRHLIRRFSPIPRRRWDVPTHLSPIYQSYPKVIINPGEQFECLPRNLPRSRLQKSPPKNRSRWSGSP
jgi:hypothetical protein